MTPAQPAVIPTASPVAPASPPPAPTLVPLPATYPHADLHKKIIEALRAAPSFFQSPIRILGLPATDLHTLNGMLGAAIEDRIIDTLNRMRAVWDPDEKYTGYTFQRQSQTFPDVLFRLRNGTGAPLFGIELKGWYLLALEGEPSFRFQATAAVCAPPDLLVIYPWHLSEVISGEPVLVDPFIESAKYVAEYRNWFWENRPGVAPNPVIKAPWSTPYPSKSDLISDHATNDSGDNFGRISRVGLLKSFVDENALRLMAGISADSWRTFLSVFAKQGKKMTIESAMKKVKEAIGDHADDEKATFLASRLLKVAEIFESKDEEDATDGSKPAPAPARPPKAKKKAPQAAAEATPGEPTTEDVVPST